SRMLGSAFEADDAVQETMLRAWKAAEGFEGRSSLRSWLYRIATNVCLDALRGEKRRALPMDLGPASPPVEAHPRAAAGPGVAAGRAPPGGAPRRGPGGDADARRAGRTGQRRPGGDRGGARLGAARVRDRAAASPGAAARGAD